jgi:hypothetical protein
LLLPLRAGLVEKEYLWRIPGCKPGTAEFYSGVLITNGVLRIVNTSKAHTSYDLGFDIANFE